MSVQKSAGEFPYVVDLYRPKAGTKDAFGHIPTTYTQAGMAAARVWTTSTSGATRDAGELVVHTPRLELRMPIKGIEPGWRVTWKAATWSIDATEEQGDNLVITLSKV